MIDNPGWTVAIPNFVFQMTKTASRSLGQSSLVCLFAFLGMPGLAFALPTNATGGTDEGWPSALEVPSFSDWPYSLMCLLLATYSCVSLRYPGRFCLKIHFGLMTAIVDLAWMIIVLDGTLSPSTRWR